MISGSRDEDRADAPALLMSTRVLTRTLAHDLNNLLQIVSGNAELLTMDLSPANAQYVAATAIAEASRQAAVLTRQLLVWARELESAAKPAEAATDR